MPQNRTRMSHPSLMLRPGDYASVARAIVQGAPWRDGMQEYAPDDHAAEGDIAAWRVVVVHLPHSVAHQAIARIVERNMWRVQCAALHAIKRGAPRSPGLAALD